MRPLRSRDIKQLSQGHTASVWEKEVPLAEEDVCLDMCRVPKSLSQGMQNKITRFIAYFIFLPFGKYLQSVSAYKAGEQACSLPNLLPLEGLWPALVPSMMPEAPCNRGLCLIAASLQSPPPLPHGCFPVSPDSISPSFCPVFSPLRTPVLGFWAHPNPVRSHISTNYICKDPISE